MEDKILDSMQKPIPDWVERVERLARPENFHVRVMINDDDDALGQVLSPEEWRRLEIKLAFVEKFAAYMAAGMLKGCLKYTADDWTVESWMGHLIGEGADQANYQILLYEAWLKDQNAK